MSSSDESTNSNQIPKSNHKSSSHNGNKQNQLTLSDYLDENSHITTKSAKHSILSTEDIIGDDDEIFIIQCPKSIDIEKLSNKKIKRIGKKTIAEKDFIVDIESTVFNDDEDIKYSTLICNNKTENSIKSKTISFKPAGIVKIQKRIDEICVPIIEKTKEQPVPYPKNLKIRHPIHGFNYENSIQLPEVIKKRIQTAVQLSKNSNCKIERNDDDCELIKSEDIEVKKKISKRKRKVSILDHLDDEKELNYVSKESKISRLTENDDGANLDWLASI